MKRLLLILVVGAIGLLLFGCSDTPTTGPENQAITLTPRPEFVDTRPADVIENFIVHPSPDFAAMKKPPKPDPDPDPGGDDPNPNPPHKYAYVVGISDYEGYANDLQFCDDDARDMKAYLQSQGFSVMMDLDRNATADAITDGLQWLINSAQPGDEVAFCYSGHGAKAPGSGSSIISTDLYYVTHGYVMSYFNAIDCTKKLVTLDACVIGDFHSDTETGTFMATASNKTNSYDAPDLNQGAWTYYFLEAADDLGYPFAEDVAVYAEDGMEAWASQYHLRVSPKHTDKYTGMFDM